MRSGNLKHKIEIQQYTSTRSETGAQIKEWSEFKTVYASIVPQSAREFFSAGMHAEATHKIEMRYIPGVKPDMRIKYGARIFEISAPPINIRELNKTLQIVCKELL